MKKFLPDNILHIIVLWLLLMPFAAFAQEDCPTAMPSLNFEEDNQLLCDIPGTLSFTITKESYQNNANKYCDYYIWFDDTSTDVNEYVFQKKPFKYSVKLSNEELAAVNGVITHEYNKSYCKLYDHETYWYPTVYVISRCNEAKAKKLGFTAYVQQKGTVAFDADPMVCIGEPTKFYNNSLEFTDFLCEKVQYYEWNFDDCTAFSTDINPVHTYSCPGNYNVRLVAFASDDRNSCGSDTIYKSVSVIPIPKLKQKNNIEKCKGETVPEVSLSELDYCKYNFYNHNKPKCEDRCEEINWCDKFPNDPVVTSITYTVSGDDIGLSASPYTKVDKIPSFKAVNESDVPKVCKVCVIPYNKLNCPGEQMCYTITVLPGAKLNDIGDISQCHGTTINVPKFTSSVAGATFKWEVVNGDWQTIGMTSNSGDSDKIPNFTANNTTTSPITVTIKVTANVTCGSADKEFKITVKPISEISDISTEPVCTDQQFSVIPVNGTNGRVVPGTTYSWGIPETTGGMTGKSGTGESKISGNLTNPTATNQTATYIVTPTTGTCTGSPFKVVATIKPKATIKPQSITICSGESIPQMTWSGSNVIPEGTKYSWAAPSVSGISGTTGRTNQDYFSQGIITNNTASSINVVYQITPIGECESPKFNVTVTVKPTPKISNYETTTCSDVAFSSQPPSGGSNIIPSGTKYSWTIPIMEEGITNGAADSNKDKISGNLHNSKSTASYATYNVTPSANDCSGTPFDLKVNVNPKAQSIVLQDVEICNGKQFSVTPVDGTDGVVPSNTTYSWSKPTVTEGITGGEAKSNQSNIFGTLTNTTNKNQTATYTITPKSGDCTGDAFTLKVTVLPSVTADITGDATVCVGTEPAPKITFTGMYGVKPYTFTYKVNGGANQTITTTADNESVSLDVDVSSAKTETYTLLSVIDQSTSACEGTFDKSVTVNVLSAPTVNITQAEKQTVCIGGQPGLLTANVTSQAEVLSYQWKLNDTNISGATLSTYQPKTSELQEAKDYKYSVVVKFKTQGCSEISADYTVKVVANPEITESVLDNQELCQNATAAQWSVTANGGVGQYKYQWYRNGQKLDNDNAKKAIYTPSTTEIGEFTYYCEITTTDSQGKDVGCYVKSGEAHLKVVANPSLTLQPQSEALCKDGEANQLKVEYKDGLGTAIYQWYDNNGAISGETESTFTPATSTVGEFSYYCKITFNDGGCQSLTSNNATLTVVKQGSTIIAPNAEQNLCIGGSAKELSATVDGGHGDITYQWFKDGTAVTQKQTSNTYTPEISALGIFKYKVVAEFSDVSCESAPSDEVTVNVVEGPTIKDAQLAEQDLCQNATANEWSVNVDGGAGTPTYQWYRDGEPVTGATSKNYKPSTSTVGSFKYKCKVIMMDSEGRELGCTVESNEAVLKVNVSPTVTLSTIDDACEGKTIKLKDYVTYDWKDLGGAPILKNEVLWSVKKSDGTEILPEDKKSLEYPELTFTDADTYTINVTISNGFDCGAASQRTASATVRIVESDAEYDISVSPTELCVNNDVVFTNNTLEKYGFHNYEWVVAEGVEGTDYEYTGGTSETSTAPKIKFKEPGTYNIKATAENTCGPKETETYTIKVHKSPSVKLKIYDKACVGVDKVMTVPDSVNYNWYEPTISKTCVWSAVPSEGIEFSDVSAEEPTIKFTKSGDYTIKITVSDGYDACPGTREATANVTVYEDFELKIEEPSKDICYDNRTVRIVNNTQKDESVSYSWTVKDSTGTEVLTSTDRAPQFTMPNYGRYTIELTALNNCFPHTLTTPFEVAVHKDPEVIINELDSTCTNKPVVMNSEIVQYEWYLETGSKPVWSVYNAQGQEITEGITISDPNAEYPTITFENAGVYTVRVSMPKTSPVECGTPMYKEQPIVIIESAAGLTINPDITELCEGGVIIFNNTTPAEYAYKKYDWKIPENAQFVDETSASSESPHIKFNKNGTFTVTATATNTCGNSTYKFEDIKVHKQSTVSLKHFTKACTNVPIDLKDSVSYVWDTLYSERKYTWSITPADGASLSATDAEYPVLTFTKSGEYELSVKISDGYDQCGGHSEDKTTIVVYMADFELNVSQSSEILCINETETFTNTTDQSQGISYKWSVNKASGWNFEGSTKTDYAPKIKFTEPDRYIVTLTASNRCEGSSKHIDFNVRVNQDPEVEISPLDTLCNSAKLVLDNTKVVYDWHNSPDVEHTAEWSVTDLDGNDVEGVTIENKTDLYPTISFTKPITYKLTAKINGYGCPDSEVTVSQQIVVIDSKFELKLKADTLQGCVGTTGFSVSMINTTDNNQGVTYKWSVNKTTGWTTQDEMDAYSPTFTFHTAGLYDIYVEAANKCTTKYDTFRVVAHTVVTAEMLDMADVCGEYTFDAGKMMSIIGDTTDIKSVEWSVVRSEGDSPDNYEYLMGDKNSLRPIIHINKFGTYTISATIEAICNTETVSKSIKIDEPIDLKITSIDALCPNIRDEFNQNPVQLVATPSGDEHKWSITGGPAEWIEAETGKFYPNAPGMYEAMYYVKIATCDASGSIPVEVREYPSLTMGDDIRVCYKDTEPRVLEETGTVPAGGVWKGNNVTLTNDVYYYNPPLLVGSDTLTYTITDEFGCKNRDGIRAYVMALPKTGFENNIPCMPDPVIFTPEADLVENKFFIDYGDETAGTILQHLYDTIGVYNVKLIVTASSGCVDSLTKTLTVEKVPDQKIMLSERSGCSVFSPEITPIYTYIDSVNTTFLWTFGDFKTDDKMIPDSVGFSADVEDVTYPITFTVENLCGSTTEENSVHVYALPKSVFETGRHGGCSPVPINMINSSTGSTIGMKYKWDFGDGTSSEERFPTHKFTSPLDSVSVYSIKLTTENLCGVDSAFRDVTITSSVIKPQVYSITPTACVGLPVCFMDKTIVLNPDSTVIQYTWDFGNGDKSNTNCTVYNDVGPYTVKLTIGTECGSIETDSLTIKLYNATDIAVKAQTINCAKDTVSPLLIADMDSIKALSWSFGDGSYSSLENPKHVYYGAGDYMIKVTATAANFGSCLSRDSVLVTIKPLPNPTIDPIMYDSCGPILYAPLYSEDLYTKVDYKGDGHAISASEFLYENHTLEPVIYYPHFYFEDQFGCKSEQEGRIRIYPQPKAMFSISEVENERPEIVHLKNESFGSDNCTWVLPYSGEILSCNDTIESFMYNDEKDMTIKVSNIYGCTDAYTLQYQPMMKGLYFPNTFVPDGVTEDVRTFNGVGIGLKEYELEIFDLYGNLIYKTTSLDANGMPDKGWDGRDNKGNLMPQDVYTWKAKAVFIDNTAYPYGNSKGTSKETLHRGSVLLLEK